MEKSLYEEEGEAASYFCDKNAGKNLFYTSFKPTGIQQRLKTRQSIFGSVCHTEYAQRAKREQGWAEFQV